MILMGDYEILCNEDKTRWEIKDRLNPSSSPKFSSLSGVLKYIRVEIENVEIEKEQ